jgi:hypothetical protein
MNNTIYNLRNVQLDPALAAKLFPFINAYRPHDAAPTWREFKADGVDKIEEESLMDLIEDQYEADTRTLEGGLPPFRLQRK